MRRVMSRSNSAVCLVRSKNEEKAKRRRRVVQSWGMGRDEVGEQWEKGKIEEGSRKVRNLYLKKLVGNEVKNSR